MCHTQYVSKSWQHIISTQKEHQKCLSVWMLMETAAVHSGPYTQLNPVNNPKQCWLPYCLTCGGAHWYDSVIKLCESAQMHAVKGMTLLSHTHQCFLFGFSATTLKNTPLRSLLVGRTIQYQLYHLKVQIWHKHTN